MHAPTSSAADLAKQLNLSEHAIDLCRSVEFIDLHLDTFIPVRLVGYDMQKRHDDNALHGRFFGHLDFPRMEEIGLTGAMWSITTNPFRTAKGRWRTFEKNLARMQALMGDTDGEYQIVSTASEYSAARERNAHGVLVVIQGGNALSPKHGYADGIAGDVVTAVTLVHLTHNYLGLSSVPYPYPGREPGLTTQGRELVENLDSHRIFVDLAHISREGFWDAVEVHDKSLPLIDTHTGCCGVKEHWRNLDDKQMRAVADSGGVVAIIFEPNFLTRPDGPTDVEMIVEHIDYAVSVIGEDAVSLGSDYDGAIQPPRDMRNGLEFPRVVQGMLDRGYSDERVAKIMGANFLRSWALLRP